MIKSALRYHRETVIVFLMMLKWSLMAAWGCTEVVFVDEGHGIPACVGRVITNHCGWRRKRAAGTEIGWVCFSYRAPRDDCYEL